MQSKQLQQQIIDDVVEMCMVEGVVIKSNGERSNVEYEHLPISPFPTPYPSNQYHQALEYQPYLGKLLSDLVHTPQNIHSVLGYFEENNDFLKQLIRISKVYNEQKIKQDIHLMILRTDYMVDERTNSLKLVEFNTIAAGLSSLSQKVWDIQNYIMDKYCNELRFNYPEHMDDGLATNSIKEIGRSFKMAMDLYRQSMAQRFGGKYEKEGASDYRILFVIDENERNIGDQKTIEVELYKSYRLKCIRMTFDEISQNLRIDSETNALTIKGYEIGLVYYRSGYSIEQYKSEKDWQTREALECSMSVKCPSIDVHLTTFKKIQQAFENESYLQQIIKKEDTQTCEKISHLFKGLWSLEFIEDPDHEIQSVIKNAIERPSEYVIKPQKEGGGNNFYDEDVRKMLLELNKDELKQYLIMERITPPVVPAYMLRKGALKYVPTISELGIFSSVIIDTNQDEPLENSTFGRLFRTKCIESNEGGVISGHSVVDHPWLIEHTDLKRQIQPIIEKVQF